MSKNIFILIWFYFIILLNISVGQNMNSFFDSLIYSNKEELIKVWRLDSGENIDSIIEFCEKGIKIKDIFGDCYEEKNNQKAVILRKPKFEKNYYFQADISNFIPISQYAQAGLVVWKDLDNYVRNTIGFKTAGTEGLAEFNGKSRSRGVHSVYPTKNPFSATVRIEILTKTIRTYIFFDSKLWLSTGGFTLPENIVLNDFIQGIGILGIGGEMADKPLFSNWKEGAISSIYQDNNFDDKNLNENWITGQTNAGWGSENSKVLLHKGHLIIKPFSGSDIYLGNENYPFAAIPAPQDDEWALEVKINSFNPFSKGKYNKGGMVLWQDNQHYIILTLVCENESKQIYFESLSAGDKGQFFGGVNNNGFSELKITDAYLRLKKEKEENKFSLKASYDGKTWLDLGTYNNTLPEPQIRLFATGDISVQYPKDYNFEVKFDYIKKIVIDKF